MALAIAPPPAGDGTAGGAGGQQPSGKTRGRPGRKLQLSVACQVPGCGAELVQESSYYKRYRICREHSAAACLCIEGRELRFCRPCARMHELSDFDGKKASCRSKLQLGKARRRTAQRLMAMLGGGGGKGPSEGSGTLPGDAPKVEAKGDSSSSSQGTSWCFAAARPPALEEGAAAAGAGGASGSPARLPGLEQAQALLSSSGQPSLLEDLDLVQLLSAVEWMELGDAPGAVAEADPEAPSDLWLEMEAAQLTCADPPHDPSAYASDESITRLSLKIFNCTPDLLAPDVRAELESMLGGGPLLLEGFIRPGCLHFLANILTTSTQRAALCSAPGLQAFLKAVMARSVFGNQPTALLAQVSHSVALAIGGPAAPPPLLAMASVPAFTAAIPLCALPGSGRHSLQGVDMTAPPGAPRASLHCRQLGRNLVLELLDRGRGAGAAAGACRCRGGGGAPGDRPADGGSCCPVVNIGGLHIGYADVEVQLGKVLSAPRAILVLPDAAAVQEVRSLEATAAGIPDVDAFLRNAGLVMQYLYRDQAPNPGQYDALWARQEVLSRLAALAQELVVVSLARGWPALVRLLLPAITAGKGSADAALAAMESLCPSSLADLVAFGGSNQAAAALVEWAYAEGAAEVAASLRTALDLSMAGPSKAAPLLKRAASEPVAGGALVRCGGGGRREFVAAYQRQQLGRDIIIEIISLIISVVFVARALMDGQVFLATLPLLLMTITSTQIFNICIIALASRQSPAYLRLRTPILVTLRLVRGVIGFILMANFVHKDYIHPVRISDAPSRFLLHVLRMPLACLLATVCHALPLLANVLATLGFVALFMHYIIGRCALECAVPGQSGRYEELLGAMLPGVREAGSSTSACLAVNIFVMLYVGAVVPLWVTACLEQHAWRRWQGTGVARSTTFFHACGITLAAAPCLLLALLGARAWEQSI